MSEQQVLDTEVEEPGRASSRRGMLRLAAGAAAGAGVAMVVSKASPAAAADTEPVTSGDVNQADLSTEFVYGTGANGTASTIVTEVVTVDSSASPDDRDALHAVAGAGTALVAESDTGRGLLTGGGLAALQLVSVTGTAPATRATPGELGMIDIDAQGNVWVCVVATAAGPPAVAAQWRKIAGAATAGAFHAIDPIRCYDSRVATYTPGGGSPMAPNTNRIISVKDSHNRNGGALITADVIPVGATAVALNATIASPTANNFLSVVAGDAADFNTSTVNWGTTGADVANSAIVRIDAQRRVKVFMGDQPGSAHVIIDVTGYYL